MQAAYAELSAGSMLKFQQSGGIMGYLIKKEVTDLATHACPNEKWRNIASLPGLDRESLEEAI